MTIQELYDHLKEKIDEGHGDCDVTIGLCNGDDMSTANFRWTCHTFLLVPRGELQEIK